jgi:dTDP-4-dehydrorhamnose reductase
LIFPGEKDYYNENDEKSPICEYGAQKSELENLLLNLSEKDNNNKVK